MGKNLTTGITKSCGCIKSSGESLIISILQKLNINYEYQKKFNDLDRLFIFDFYLPDDNTIIEYNGIQHYEPVEYFGGEIRFQQQLEIDEQKKEWCKQKGFKFLEISYKQFSQLNEEFLKNLIKEVKEND